MAKPKADIGSGISNYGVTLSEPYLGILLKGFLGKFRRSGNAGRHAGWDSGLFCLSVGTYKGNLYVKCPSVSIRVIFN